MGRICRLARLVIPNDRCNETMTRHALDPLLCPRSIAFVGASDRPDSTGAAMLAMCRIDGFDGVVYG